MGRQRAYLLHLEFEVSDDPSGGLLPRLVRSSLGSGGLALRMHPLLCQLLPALLRRQVLPLALSFPALYFPGVPPQLPVLNGLVRL